MDAAAHPAWADLADTAAVLDDRLVSTEGLAGAPAPDVVVVGLGASGLEACVALAQRGASVVGLDAVGVAAGAAGANGGFLLAGLASFHDEAVARHGRDVAVGWYRRTLEELDRLADTEPSFERIGSLRIAHDDGERARIEQHLRQLRADGLPGEPYDGTHGVGLLVPGDGRFQPLARCRRLAREALDAGARLVAPARVACVTPDAAVHVAGLGAPLQPRAVLVAVDGQLDRLVPELAGDVVTWRLQMLATAPDHGVDVERPLYLRDGLDYVQQRPAGELLVGGGRDLDGEDAVGGARVTTDRVQRHLDQLLARLGGAAPVTHRWAAHAAFTQDRLPVDVRLHDHVHVVGAYSGHGNVLGGLLAREAAARLL